MEQNHIGETLLSESEIKNGVALVARSINKDYRSVVAVCVTPGGIIFTADLVRQLTIEVKMDYISCPHTPGDSVNQSEIVYHENVALTGQDVILIDDAIESGGTMKRLIEFISSGCNVKSLSIATLFVKKNRRDLAVNQYYAFELDIDQVLVGYGLPWQDSLRNLPYVAKLER